MDTLVEYIGASLLISIVYVVHVSLSFRSSCSDASICCCSTRGQYQGAANNDEETIRWEQHATRHIENARNSCCQLVLSFITSSLLRHCRVYLRGEASSCAPCNSPSLLEDTFNQGITQWWTEDGNPVPIAVTLLQHGTWTRGQCPTYCAWQAAPYGSHNAHQCRNDLSKFNNEQSNKL